MSRNIRPQAQQAPSRYAGLSSRGGGGEEDYGSGARRGLRGSGGSSGGLPQAPSRRGYEQENYDSGRSSGGYSRAQAPTSSGTSLRGGGAKWAPTSMPADDPYQEPPEPSPIEPGAGSSMWSRMVAVAGNLTVNVTKAWDGTADDEPETPPGGETRLTRLMKKYYLQKAKSVRDLPPWLFDENELPSFASSARTTSNSRHEDTSYSRPPPPSINTRPVAQRNGYQDSAYSPAVGNESKATSRLKALHSKRPVYTQPAPDQYQPADDYDDRNGRNWQDPEPQRAPVRVGLPSGPGRRRG